MRRLPPARGAGITFFWTAQVIAPNRQKGQRPKRGSPGDNPFTILRAMSDNKAGPLPPVWPQIDPEGRPVAFTSREARPRPDEYLPVLDGEEVRLEPMNEGHLEALCAIGLDPEVWRFMPFQCLTREQMAGYVRDGIAARQSLAAIPFVTVLKGKDTSVQVVGTSRFMSIDSKNRRMEIGSTWIGRKWQRTRVNTEAKYLMLRHAFEVLQCIRIEFKTDSLNERSRRALLRIGATQEGISRNHLITTEGRIRHSVYFSITAAEWPDRKARLEGMLA
jgi:RimJ/RimL family protein N-acetyltransferase